MRLTPELHAEIGPLPDDFRPHIEHVTRGKVSYVIWRGTVPQPGREPLKLEYGFSTVNGTMNVEAEKEKLRLEVWRITRLADMGRHDLIAHARTDRHQGGRVISAPPKLDAPPAQQ